MTPASIANMRRYYSPGVLAYSPATGEEYSANPSDYWDAGSTYVLTDANGDAMQLVTRHTVYVDVAEVSQ